MCILYLLDYTDLYKAKIFAFSNTNIMCIKTVDLTSNLFIYKIRMARYHLNYSIIPPSNFI